MITTLSGPNAFLLNMELRNLRDTFIQDIGDLGYEVVDGEESDSQRMTEAIQSLPFLAPKKLVVLKNPGAQKQFAEHIEGLLAGVPETNDVILVEPKIDKRSSYYKVLKAKTEYKEFTTLEPYQTNNWIVQYTKDKGGSIDSSDAQYLVQRIGPNQQLLAAEVDKLLTHNPKIERTSIDVLTEPTPTSTIFELLDAAFAGRLKRVSELYNDQRALKVEPQQIMALLAWQLHALAVVKAAGDRSAEDVAKISKLNPFVIRKTQQLARQLAMAEIKALINRALRLDVRLKTQNVDANEALQHFLLTLT